MKRKVVLLAFLFVCLFLITNLEARPVKVLNSQTRILDYRWMQANDMNMPLFNNGLFGQTSGGDAGFYWPGGYPNETYIYGSAMWIGGRYRSDTNPSVYDTFVTCGYNPNSGVNEFVQGLPPNDDPSNPYEKVYFSSDADWPLENSVGEDSIISILDSYYTYNDYDTTHHIVPENLPLDISIIQQTYAFTGYLKDDILFFVVNIILDSSKDTLHGAFLSICTDCDIGNEAGTSANDIVGFNKEYNMAYQWQNNAEPGWAHFPGTIAFKFLEGPKSNGVDTVHYYNNGLDSIVIGPDDTLGMTAFKIFTIDIDPSNKYERYQMMSGYNYMGLDPLNPEASYYPFDLDAFGPCDKRFIMSAGPFNMIPGDTAKIIFAVLMATDTIAIYTTADKAQAIYDSGMQSVKEISTLPIAKFDIKSIGNNIFRERIDLEYNIINDGNVDISIYDACGRLITRLVDSYVKSGSHSVSWEGIDLRGNRVKNGIYFVAIESEGKSKNTKVMLIK
jgi:hypothetical protein